MTNFIPIFPLDIVVFPGEILNLHIFEDQYKQLIKDCHSINKPFGIPTVIQDTKSEMGCLVQIDQIAQTYDGGEMDIRTRGLKVFRILEVINNIPDKMYKGAIVNYPANSIFPQPLLMPPIMDLVRKLHHLLNVSKKFGRNDEELISYDIAHHVGFSITEEIELLALTNEPHRLQYISNHLNKIIPIVSGTEKLKERIQLNGHFKELKGFNL